MAKKIIAIVFIILSFTSLIRTTIILWENFLPDFSTRYNSGILLLKHKDPYINLNSFTPENYPPFALLFHLPFSFLSLQQAEKIWLIISLFSFFLTLIILCRFLPLSFFKFSLFFLLSSISFPLKFTLGMGQINLILLFIVVAFIALLQKRNNIYAACMLSLAISLKLFPITYIIIPFVKKQWKLLFITCYFLGIFFLLPIFFFGQDITVYYFTKIFTSLAFGSSGGDYYNQSITGFLSRLSISSNIIFIIKTLLFGIFLIHFTKSKRNHFYMFSLTTLITLLLNNFTWQHHLILLLPVYWYLFKSYKNNVSLFLLFISYILVVINIANPGIFINSWYRGIILSHGFFGMVLLLCLLLSLAKKNSKDSYVF